KGSGVRERSPPYRSAAEPDVSRLGGRAGVEQHVERSRLHPGRNERCDARRRGEVDGFRKRRQDLGLARVRQGLGGTHPGEEGPHSPGDSSTPRRAAWNAARGAVATPAPTWPRPPAASRMPVVIRGVTSSVTTRRRSMPIGEPEKSRYGMRNLVLRAAQIDSIARVAATAPAIFPPRKVATAGDAAAAAPPSPRVSSTALSPMSGAASVWP